jgi:hypothetical protein
MTDLTAVIDELPESQREQGLRLQATRWAAVRGSAAVWRRLQATGERFAVTSRTPRTVGECLQVTVAAYDAARGRPGRHASWPCKRSRTAGCSKTGPGVGRVLDRADRAPPRPRR